MGIIDFRLSLASEEACHRAHCAQKVGLRHAQMRCILRVAPVPVFGRF